MNKKKLSIYVKSVNLFRKSLSGVTLTEILVVMILSGILFLFLFDGLNIINTYGQLTRGKLEGKIELLNGHHTLNLLLEKTDSIKKEGSDLLLLNSEMEITRIITDSNLLILYRDADHMDTLFTHLKSIKSHILSDNTQSVDSIYVSLLIGRDTLLLSYGLPPNNGFNLNNKPLDYDTEY